MSTIIVGGLLVAAIIIICYVLLTISGRQTKKRKDKLLTEFSKVGTANNMTYTAQEILKNKVIGIDGVSRKMAVVEEKENVFQYVIFHLSEIKECRLEKNYFQIPITSGGRDEKVLESIALLFTFLDSAKEPQQVVFYNHIQNHVYEISELEVKAAEWKGIVTKFCKKKELIAAK